MRLFHMRTGALDTIQQHASLRGATKAARE